LGRAPEKEILTQSCGSPAKGPDFLPATHWADAVRFATSLQYRLLLNAPTNVL